jgi:hypothetical protein
LFVNDGVRSRSVPLASVVRLAKLTGGRSFAPPTFSEDTVRTVLQIVSESIRCEYVVGVSPSLSPGGPKRHDIEIRLRSKAMGQLWGGKRTIRY